DPFVLVLKDRAIAIKDLIARLDLLFKQEETAASKIQSFLPIEQTFKKDIERTEKLFEAVVARLDEVSIIQDYEGDKVRVIEPAQAGDSRGWTLLRTLLTAAAAGMGLGFGIAFFFEQFDDSFASPGEIRSTLDAPILAQIPRFKSKSAATPDSSIAETIHTYHHPRSRSSEAIRGMRTALYFNARHQRSQVLQFTSPMPADGKSTLVANLAVAIANSGKTVVIVDADCRRPTAHKIFGIDQGDGLVQLIRGETELDDAVVATEVDGLFLIRSGGIPDYPSELISSESFDNLLEVLRESFDFVLVDSPPVLAVTDGAAIAAKVDGVVMVLRLTDKARNLAVRARQMLDGVDANLIGVVVNAVERNSKSASYRSYSNYGYGNGYGYGYGYGAYGEEIHEYYEEGNSKTRSSNGKAHPLRIASDEAAG
ncbi:MAG: polysaccharide biosynthesis tyrosine autokinase, partial [Planctomycetota bacterium]